MPSLAWLDEAACKWVDPMVMHPEFGLGQARSRIQKAKAICAECPVIDQCRRYAIANDIETGIYGGMTYEERIEAEVSG